MADKRVKARLGETVTIQLARRKKPAPTKKAEERRYGPPPFLDEETHKRRGKFTTIYFLNQQSRFNQVATFDSIPPERHLRFQSDWTTDALLSTFVSLAKNTGVRRYSDSTSFVVYRQGFNKHPLPYNSAEDYGVALKLNNVEKALSLSNSEWIAYDPQAILDALLLRQANGETGLESQITAAELEVEEWAAAYGSPQTFWAPIATDEQRAYGYYKKKINRKTRYAVESSGNFESFDPFDTVNYKVTQGSFASAEVAAPLLSNRTVNDLRLGLLPKYWNVIADYVSWWFQPITSGTNRIWRRSNNVSGQMTAITTPYFNEVSPGFNAALANKFTRVFAEFSGGVFGSINHPSPVVYETNGKAAPFDDTHRKLHMETLQVTGSPRIMSVIGARDLTFTNEGSHPADSKEHLDSTNASLAITERDRAVGDLVGLFSVNNSTYFVYRKTADTRGASVFSGAWDSVVGCRSTFFYSFLDTYQNPFQSRTDRDFTYYDPTGIFNHMTA